MLGDAVLGIALHLYVYQITGSVAASGAALAGLSASRGRAAKSSD